MADNKKWYWFKLKDSFFNRPEIKIIEKMPSGAEYIIILLKIILLTLNTNGKLIFKRLNIQYDIKTLSFILEHSENKISKAISIFKKYKLIKIDKSGLIIVTNKTIQEMRSINEYKEWRKNVFKRDNYTCQKCKIKGGILNAHHIIQCCEDENRMYDIDNGITLCKKCHNKIHSKENK